MGGRRLLIGCLVGLLVTTALGTGVSARAAGDTVTFTFVTPDGAVVPGAEVAVYLQPFDPPCSFKPPLLARSEADSSGQLEVNMRRRLAIHTHSELLPDSTEKRINVKVMAVDPAKEQIAVWNTIVPLARSHSERVVLAMDVPADNQDVSVDELLEIERTEVLNAEDSTVDPEAEPTDPEPTSDPRGLDHCFTDPTPTTDGDEGFIDPEGATSSECSDPSADEWRCTVKRQWRWGKMSQLHSDIGVRSTYSFEDGRDTAAGIAIKYPGQGWSASGSAFEERSRGVGRDRPLKGNDRHELVLARYRWYKWRHKQIVGPGRYMYVYEWRVHHWDYETSFRFSSSEPVGASYYENRKYGAEIRAGASIWRRTGANRTFEVGFEIANISLISRAGFSEDSKLQFTGVGSCNAPNKTRYAYGDGVRFREAKEIYVFSFCTN